MQKTNYPWDGDVKLTVIAGGAIRLHCESAHPGLGQVPAKVIVNGKSLEGAQPGQYLAIKRRWSPGDTVILGLPMAPEIVASNPRVDENLGRVAVQRGPIVYCMEGLDQQGPAAKDFSEVTIVVNSKSLQDFKPVHQPTLLGGVTVLHHQGVVTEPSQQDALYAPASPDAPKTHAADLTMIPYYAWANRQHTSMQVWIPYTRA